MLVLGADADTIISRRDVRQTAATYGVRPEFLAETGHDLMLDPQWPKVAERIAEWLSAQSF